MELTKAGECVLDCGALEGSSESDRGGVSVLADPVGDDTGDVGSCLDENE